MALVRQAQHGQDQHAAATMHADSDAHSDAYDTAKRAALQQATQEALSKRTHQ